MRPAASGGSTLRHQRRSRFRKQRRRGRVLAVGDRQRAARRSTRRADPCDGQRGRHDPAAEDLARRGDGVEPPRRHLTQHAERLHDALELVELPVEERDDLLALNGVDDDLRHRGVALPAAREDCSARRRCRRRRRWRQCPAAGRSPSTSPRRRRSGRGRRRPPAARRPDAAHERWRSNARWRSDRPPTCRRIS